MAEIELKFNGDSSSAQEAMTGLGNAVGEGVLKFELLKEAMEKVIEFTKESIKEWRESERAARQLQLAVGKDMAGAFGDSAEAMERHLGVSKEMVEKMQGMLYRFGEAPKEIDKTVKALLDYSAVTGGDAVQAAEQLLRAADGGRKAFRELGLQYDETKSKSENVVIITEALAKKVGGAADQDAQSLSGKARIAEAAFKDLQKEYGKFITELVSSTGSVNVAAEALHGLRIAIFGDAESDKKELKMSELVLKTNTAMLTLKDAQKDLADAKERGNEKDIAFYTKIIANAKEELAELKREAMKEVGGTAALGSANPNDGMTAKAADEQKKAWAEHLKQREEQYKKEEADFKRYWDHQAELVDAGAKHRHEIEAKAYFMEHELDKKWAEAKIVLRKETQDKLEKQATKEYERESLRLEAFLEKSTMSEEDKDEARLKLSMEYANRHLQLLEEQYRFEDELHKKAIERQREMERKAYQKQQEEFKHNAMMLQHIAAQMGQTIGSGLGQAIGAGIAGTGAAAIEAEVFQTIGHAIVSAVATAIATIPGAGWVLGPIMQAMGTVSIDAIAAEMRNAATEKAKSQTQSQMAELKFHDGGWIGAPRYHSGSWVGPDEQPAILQTGERVLSRSEVARMGGAAAVDGHANGAGQGRGPAVTVHIQAIDTQGVKKFFEDTGGDGFRRAIQSGKGDIARMFGKGKIF